MTDDDVPPTFTTILRDEEARLMLYRAMYLGRRLTGLGAEGESNDVLFLRLLGVDSEDPRTRQLADETFVQSSVEWVLRQHLDTFDPSDDAAVRSMAMVALHAMTLGLSTGRAIEHALIERGHDES